MSDVFNITDQETPKEGKEKNLTVDEIKHEALKEIAKSPMIKKYFSLLITQYNKNILELAKPATIAKTDDMLQWYAKRDSLERLLKAAKEEVEKK